MPMGDRGGGARRTWARSLWDEPVTVLLSDSQASATPTQERGGRRGGMGARALNFVRVHLPRKAGWERGGRDAGASGRAWVGYAAAPALIGEGCPPGLEPPPAGPARGRRWRRAPRATPLGRGMVALGLAGGVPVLTARAARFTRSDPAPSPPRTGRGACRRAGGMPQRRPPFRQRRPGRARRGVRPALQGTPFRP